MSELAVSRRAVVRGAGLAGLAAVLECAPDAAASEVTRRGQRGPDVRGLQRRLSDLGYWCGAVDGAFGSTTEQAVLALQKVARLSRDGIVGPATRKALRDAVRPRARHGGHGTEVDKERQVVLVVRGGRVVHTFNTSTGNGKPFEYHGRTVKAVTPSGTFRIFRRVSQGWDHGSLGDLWRPYYFNGGIALHGSTQVPPYAASHGCCRLSIAAQDFLIASSVLFVGERVSVY